MPGLHLFSPSPPATLSETTSNTTTYGSTDNPYDLNDLRMPRRLQKYQKLNQDEADDGEYVTPEWDPLTFLSQNCGCFCLDSFQTIPISSKSLLYYLIILFIFLLFNYQFLLSFESSLLNFNEDVSRDCTSFADNSVCLSKNWNLKVDKNLSFPVDNFGSDQVIRSNVFFTFTTNSVPPTFLLKVTPMSKSCGGKFMRWQITFHSKGDRDSGHTVYGTGSKSVAYSSRDLPGVNIDEAVAQEFEGFMMVNPSNAEDDSLSSSSECLVNVIVLDFNVDHLSDMFKFAFSSHKQCSFSQSWTRLEDSTSVVGGHHSISLKSLSVLKFVQFAALCLLCFLCLIYFKLFGNPMVVGISSVSVNLHSKLNKIITLTIWISSFILFTLFAQLSIIAILYNWYGSHGIQCQSCILDPDQCNMISPVSVSLFLLCFIVVLVASAPQFLLCHKSMKDVPFEFDSFDYYFNQILTRASFLSVSLLPLSTASIIYLPHFFIGRGIGMSGFLFVGLLLSVFVGWAIVVCIPLLKWAEDADEYY